MVTGRSHAVPHLARPLEPTRARASKPSIVSLSGPRDGCPSTVSLSCPRDGCPSTVSLACSPPQLNQSCISGLSDSDRPENNFDLVEVGGPRLRASGLVHLAGLSIHRLQAAPHRPGGPRSHFASRPQEGPEGHVRYRGGVLAVRGPLCTYAAEPRVYKAWPSK